jgi:hypothetical protein
VNIIVGYNIVIIIKVEFTGYTVAVHDVDDYEQESKCEGIHSDKAALRVSRIILISGVFSHFKVSSTR